MPTPTLFDTPSLEGTAKRQLRLRGGNTIPLLEMDLERFIQFKNVIARLARGLFADQPGFDFSKARPVEVLLSAVEKATAEDILDLMQAITGCEDRDLLRRGFTLPAFIEAIRSVLSEDLLSVEELTGKAPGSLG